MSRQQVGLSLSLLLFAVGGEKRKRRNLTISSRRLSRTSPRAATVRASGGGVNTLVTCTVCVRPFRANNLRQHLAKRRQVGVCVCVCVWKRRQNNMCNRGNLRLNLTTCESSRLLVSRKTRFCSHVTRRGCAQHLHTLQLG